MLVNKTTNIQDEKCNTNKKQPEGYSEKKQLKQKNTKRSDLNLNNHKKEIEEEKKFPSNKDECIIA